MIDLTSIYIFIATSWLLIISPGPDTIYVLTRGVSLGKRAGIISAIGVTMGIFVHTAFAAFGISMLLMASSTLFFIVKVLGAMYLVYIGVKTIIDKQPLINKNVSISDKKNSSIFLQGLLSNTLNPKVALFFMSYLPQFVVKNEIAVSIQMLILGLIFATFTVIYLMILGYFAGKLGNWISSKEKIMRKLKVISGGILIALGIKLVFIQRKLT